jgi:hypothetical protein
MNDCLKCNGMASVLLNYIKVTLARLLVYLSTRQLEFKKVPLRNATSLVDELTS